MSALRPQELAGLAYVKGHGTENDFIVFADPEGRRPLTASMAAWLCDRRRGLGADGAIRAVKLSACDVAVPGLPVGPYGRGRPDWFMDYRNADGSVAEMCGNGIRVFVEFLRACSLAAVADGETIPIATRGGIRMVTREGGRYAVDMGQVPSHLSPFGRHTGEQAGMPEQVSVMAPGLDGPRLGIRVVIPNPHVVVEVTSQELMRIDLTVPPVVTPGVLGGTNVEFVVVDSALGGPGRLRMRVHERGSGETRSCGTGVTAAALVARATSGPSAPDRWEVTVPGGELEVHVAVGRALLIGPAALVASGQVL